MKVVATLLIGLLALEHVWFLVLEMFLWRRPLGLKTFGLTQEEAESSAVLAANQGLYNGFLSSGLIWSLLAPASMSRALATFFLGCVIVAGVYGGLSAKRTILYVQALPAVIALALLLVS